MATLVSISAAGQITRLRRYEGSARSNACTHAGVYDTAGATPTNIEFYRERGAHQDVVAQPRRVSGRRARRS